MSHFDIKLISKISHEVMSPIISSRWALEIILGDKNLNIDSDKRLFLENIYSNLNRISTVSNKLINYARYFANELLPVKLNTDVSKVPHRILGYLKPAADERPKQFMRVYEIQSDETPKYNPDDFTESYWLTPQEIIEKIEAGDKAKGDIVPLLKRFYL